MPFFRKKPVVIEAIQYTGANCNEIAQFVEDDVFECDGVVCKGEESYWINTLEGVMEASPGDWVIRGVAGEFYPCKPDIFEQTYEPTA